MYVHIYNVCIFIYNVYVCIYIYIVVYVSHDISLDMQWISTNHSLHRGKAVQVPLLRKAVFWMMVDVRFGRGVLQ